MVTYFYPTQLFFLENSTFRIYGKYQIFQCYPNNNADNDDDDWCDDDDDDDKWRATEGYIPKLLPNFQSIIF